jgi:hypothetical protein
MRRSEMIESVKGMTEFGSDEMGERVRESSLPREWTSDVKG